MKSRLRLAELLATRICHDLSGPLNTLMGALELVNEDPEGAPDALPLAGDASVVLGQRLKLLRAAWGGGGGPMRVDEIAALAGGLPGRRLRLELDALDAEQVFSSEAARLVLNLLILAAESLPAGGTIHLSGDGEGHIVVQIEGRAAAWPSGLVGYLANPDSAERALADEDGAGPRLLQGPITAMLAAASGLRVSMLLGAGADGAPPLLLDLHPAPG